MRTRRLVEAGNLGVKDAIVITTTICLTTERDVACEVTIDITAAGTCARGGNELNLAEDGALGRTAVARAKVDSLAHITEHGRAGRRELANNRGVTTATEKRRPLGNRERRLSRRGLRVDSGLDTGNIDVQLVVGDLGRLTNGRGHFFYNWTREKSLGTDRTCLGSGKNALGRPQTEAKVQGNSPRGG